MKLSFQEKALIIVAIDKEIKELTSLSTIVRSNHPNLVREKARDLRELQKRFLK